MLVNLLVTHHFVSIRIKNSSLFKLSLCSRNLVIASVLVNLAIPASATDWCGHSLNEHCCCVWQRLVRIRHWTV